MPRAERYAPRPCFYFSKRLVRRESAERLFRFLLEVGFEGVGLVIIGGLLRKRRERSQPERDEPGVQKIAVILPGDVLVEERQERFREGTGLVFFKVFESEGPKDNFSAGLVLALLLTVSG